MFESCVGSVWALYGNCVAAVWKGYGRCMGTAWELYGNYMRTVWVLYGNCMGTVWELHGNCMRTVWGLYDNCEEGLALRCMVSSWQALRFATSSDHLGKYLAPVGGGHNSVSMPIRQESHSAMKTTPNWKLWWLQYWWLHDLCMKKTQTGQVQE